MTTLLSTEPILWSLCLGASRLVHKGKSKLLARIFRAPGLFLGGGSAVRGIKHISFGRNVYANRNLWLEAVVMYQDQQFNPSIEIGEGVSFSDGVHISCIERVVIKRNVLMGSRVYISDHNHGLYKGARQSRPDEPPRLRQLGGGGPVVIGENVWIGDNSIIVGPVNVGDGSIIGANSVLRGDVPPQTIVAGNPAKVIKQFNTRNQCWERV